MNPWVFFISVAGFIAGMIGMTIGLFNEDPVVTIFWGAIAIVNQNTWQFEARNT